MRRLLFSLLAFLSLGASINVAVAWACASWPPRAVGTCGGTLGKTTIDSGETRPRIHWFESREMTHGGVTRVMTKRRRPSSPIIQAPEVATVLPYWIDPTPPEELRRWTLHVGAGWPMRSLRCRFVQAPAFSCDAFGIILLSAPTAGPWNQRGLPYHPIWKGFAVNSLGFGAVIAMLWAVPFGTRRWLRVRRGCCPRCGYPIGTSPRCTECGGRVRPRTPST